MTGAVRRLEDIDLVVFDKDGTLIDFHSMWSGWAEGLADELERATGRPVREPFFGTLGYDEATGRVIHGGHLAATPMARLRDETGAVLRSLGLDPPAVDRALDAAWHAPDPVTLAKPVTDLVALFTTIRATGRRIAVATSDDRDPTERTLAALGVTAMIDAVVCADDGVPVKPAGDAVTMTCARLGIDPARTAVVGDATADLAMGRAAGARRCYGVLTGVGTRASLVLLADEVLETIAALIDD